jgi:hypothetical protein
LQKITHCIDQDGLGFHLASSQIGEGRREGSLDQELQPLLVSQGRAISGRGTAGEWQRAVKGDSVGAGMRGESMRASGGVGGRLREREVTMGQ